MTDNIIETVKALVSDGILLVRQEMELARAELSEKVEQAQTGLIEIAAGLLIALVALLVLVQSLVVALGNVMPPAVAALLVGVSLTLIALFCVKKGVDSLKAENLKPSRTIRSVRQTAETLSEDG